MFDIIQKQYSPNDAVDLSIFATKQAGEESLRTILSAGYTATDDIQKEWDESEIIEKEW